MNKKIVRRAAATPADKIPSLEFLQREVTFDGAKPHALTTKLDQGDAPELTAVGVAKLDPMDRNSWFRYVVKFKGTEVTGMAITELDAQAIAVEAAKEAFVFNFLDADRI